MTTSGTAKLLRQSFAGEFGWPFFNECRHTLLSVFLQIEQKKNNRPIELINPIDKNATILPLRMLHGNGVSQISVLPAKTPRMQCLQLPCTIEQLVVNVC